MKSYFENKDLYVGKNVHKKRWVVTARTYDLELKIFSMVVGGAVLESFLVSNLKILFSIFSANFTYR